MAAASVSYRLSDDVKSELAVQLEPISASDQVDKEKCALCFHTPFHPGGLYISLVQFTAACPLHVDFISEKTTCDWFLHIAKKRKADDGSKEPKDKISKLEDLKIAAEKEEQFEEEFRFALRPNLQQHYELTEDALGEGLLNACQALVTHPDIEQQAAATGALAWDGSALAVTRHANLQQHNNGKIVQPEEWECEEAGCGLRENLHLNLTDGSIYCGRSQFLADGKKTVGNGHAAQHYSKTGYPLVVKLGTITKDGADVYSYDEDDNVIDPNLREHLRHFGLDQDSLVKTQKTVLEMELDLNQKWEWAACTEDGASLEALYGPSYTGMINIGSSCYIASVLQALCLVPSFLKAYAGQSAAKVFSLTPVGEWRKSAHCQTAALVDSLSSGRFAIKDAGGLNGLKPTVFRRVLGEAHVDFSTSQQQDAEQYLRHVLDKLSERKPANWNEDPALDVRFATEVRMTDISSGQIRYTTQQDVILSVPVPQECLHPISDTNRSRISLATCIASAFSESMSPEFRSPVTGEQAGASITTRFKTFPRNLFIQVKRFTLTDAGEVKKLDVDVEVPDTLDLSAYRAHGPQEGETLLPADDANAKWLTHSFTANLVAMGCTETASAAAVKATGGTSLDAALDYVFSNPDATLVDDGQQSSSADAAAASKPPVIDGTPTYRLVGFITHMGSNPHSGHYVAHLLRDGRWVIYNDEKVAASQKPPRQLAYIYLYERTE